MIALAMACAAVAAWCSVPPDAAQRLRRVLGVPRPPRPGLDHLTMRQVIALAAAVAVLIALVMGGVLGFLADGAAAIGIVLTTHRHAHRDGRDADLALVRQAPITTELLCAVVGIRGARSRLVAPSCRARGCAPRCLSGGSLVTGAETTGTDRDRDPTFAGVRRPVDVRVGDDGGGSATRAPLGDPGCRPRGGCARRGAARPVLPPCISADRSRTHRGLARARTPPVIIHRYAIHPVLQNPSVAAIDLARTSCYALQPEVMTMRRDHVGTDHHHTPIQARASAARRRGPHHRGVRGGKSMRGRSAGITRPS